jgi:4,5-dihydroxyphthalate decarboxylase
MSVDTDVVTLSAAFDDYPHTLPLKRGEVKSPRLAFNFSEVRPANRFFKPMVRELKFDVSEMAIATYVQAKAYGKPLVLISPASASAFARTARPRRSGYAASCRTTTVST